MATQRGENMVVVDSELPIRWVRPWLLATLVAGAMDISAAIVTWLLRDVPASRVLQSVASGVLGRGAFEAGTGAAALGLLLHFLLMSAIAAIYVLAFRRVDTLRRSALVSGVIYGVLVYVVMTYVVVPLSASPVRTPTGRDALLGIATHIVCVGLPIALIVARAPIRAT
jgi:hypothetical protein